MKRTINKEKILIYFSAGLTFLILILLVAHIFIRGFKYLTPSLFSLKYTGENLSMLPSIINTFKMIILTLLISGPIGIFSSIYMVEYSEKNNKFISVVRLSIETLQGIPSIVYGLFGYLFFSNYLSLGYSILSGALTMSIMILPLIIRASEEALLSVPISYREASYALGAKKLRTIFNVVLPAASNGIMSGFILAMGRVFGETAALLYTAGTGLQIAGILDSGRSLAIHMYILQAEALHLKQAYATALILMLIVLLMNGLSSYLDRRMKG